MFDIGWTEILIIAVVAIIIVGPKDLPRMLRSLGRYAGQLKRTAGEFRSQFDDAIRESELDELRSTLQDTSGLNPVNQIRDSVTDSLKPLEETASDIKKGIEAKGKTDEPATGGEAEKKPAAKKKKTAARTKSRAGKEAATAKSGG